jgi:hypothetical protein
MNKKSFDYFNWIDLFLLGSEEGNDVWENVQTTRFLTMENSQIKIKIKFEKFSLCDFSTLFIKFLEHIEYVTSMKSIQEFLQFPFSVIF